MDSGTRTMMRRLAESSEDTPAIPDAPPHETEDPETPAAAAPAEPVAAGMDDATANEIRSATHAILGGSLGARIYNSVFAGDLKNMCEKLAERYDLSPAAVAEIAKGTMQRWRYATKMSLEDGTVVNVTCRLDVE
jgi:hypothetical protein